MEAYTTKEEFMEQTVSIIYAAAITGTCTIIGAYIGKKFGFEIGYREGRKHSLLEFMDILEKDLAKAIQFIESNNFDRAANVGHAIVANVKQWREIQSKFKELLNGQISALDEALQSGNRKYIAGRLMELSDAFEGKRLAVETELRKSAI